MENEGEVNGHQVTRITAPVKAHPIDLIRIRYFEMQCVVSEAVSSHLFVTRLGLEKTFFFFETALN